MFAFLAAHRRDLFGDEEFEDLFPSGRGRPSIPASVMASVLVLQTLHDLSDRETAEAARCDLRWKVATGIALDHKGFDATTLVYWRSNWLSRSGRIESTRRCAKWSPRRGSCGAAASVRWIRRFWPMPSPPRTPSPS
ncbi:transposase [Mycolicibacter algericus]|uniref:transposase n=1 Tax=Mycolicibacter algericus TaxID=1288388 RepID=UPI0035306D8F